VRIHGFVDQTMYRSLTRDGWQLSVSTWRDEKAVVRWRTQPVHSRMQQRCRSDAFVDYHLRVGQLTHDTALPAGHARVEQRLDVTEVGEGNTGPRAHALRTHLGVDQDPNLTHTFRFDSQHHIRYSDHAVTIMKTALEIVDMNEVWAAHGASRRRKRKPSCTQPGLCSRQELKNCHEFEAVVGGCNVRQLLVSAWIVCQEQAARDPQPNAAATAAASD
jgi:hypothetical protein